MKLAARYVLIAAWCLATLVELAYLHLAHPPTT